MNLYQGAGEVYPTCLPPPQWMMFLPKYWLTAMSCPKKECDQRLRPGPDATKLGFWEEMIVWGDFLTLVSRIRLFILRPA